MRRTSQRRVVWLVISLVLVGLLVVASSMSPEFLSPPDLDARHLGPLAAPPFGTDSMGIALTEYALQGARIVVIPAIISGIVVAIFATIAGVSRCAGLAWMDSVLQAFSELVGALPRLVVILVVALAVPIDWRSLVPIGIAWAFLAAPGAMDEAAATAERLGGARFVEALRAHGFSAMRIYGIHIMWMNLRSVIIRQAAEVAMQVVFLEIALSYLAAARTQPSFTHPDSTHSWASLLYYGYTALLGAPMIHALFLGLVLMAIVALTATAVRMTARAR